jgi:hypothetical protein
MIPRLKLTNFYLILTVIFYPLSLYSSEGVLKKVGIKFSGGIVNLNGGDINTLSNFWNKYFSGYEKYGKVEGNIKELHYGGEGEFEISYSLKRNFDIGFSGGVLRAQNSSLVKAYHGLGTEDYTIGEFKPSISVIPVKFSANYQIPIFSKSSLYLKGGIGYYFAKMDFRRKTEHFMGRYPSGGQRNDRAKDREIGFHGGIGLAYNIKKKIDFVIEVEGRTVKFDNLSSKHTWENWSEGSHWKYQIEGILYYVDFKPYGLAWEDILPEKYSKLFNGRKAILDLSGFSIKGGIKIKL